MTKEDIKEYLRIDFDDDDNIIDLLIITAKQYIKDTTEKEYNDNDKIYELCLKMLVSHWYENRNAIGNNVNEVPYSITNLLTILSYKI